MISLTLTTLARVLGVESEALAEITFNGVTIDSRKDCADKLFVAIKGDNFDGHQFVDQAFANGAAIALVDTRLDCDIAQLVVEDWFSMAIGDAGLACDLGKRAAQSGGIAGVGRFDHVLVAAVAAACGDKRSDGEGERPAHRLEKPFNGKTR